jgi:proteasome lid subunit RPN8/RPN11
VLTLDRPLWLALVGHAYDGLPDEAAGVLGGRGRKATVFVPCENADRSSRTFSFGKECWDKVDAEIGDAGLEIVAIVHSHTHTEAYPSPTDLAQADNPAYPAWVIVSLRPPAPSVRAFRMEGDELVEEPIEVVGR